MKLGILILFLALGGCVDPYYENYRYAPTYYYRSGSPPYYHSPNAWRYYRGYDRPWLYQRRYRHY